MELGTIIYVEKRYFDKIADAGSEQAQWAMYCDIAYKIGFFEGLIGGLDHIVQTPNQITFHDRGVNYKTNTFTLRKKNASLSYWCAKCESPKVTPGEYCWNCGTLNKSGLCLPE